MVGVIWYRFVRCGGTDWSDTLVPIRPLQWYRLKRYVGTDSSATVVPIRRYYQFFPDIRKLSLSERNDWMILDDQFFTFNKLTKVYSIEDLMRTAN